MPSAELNRLKILALILGVAAAAALRAQAAPTPHSADRRQIVAIDIGHTIAQPGAISATGVPEFRFNKRIAELLFARLRSSRVIAPYLINPTGSPISLTERARLAAAQGAAAFIAPHHAEPIPGENRPIIDKFNGVYRYDDLIVLKSAPMPAALLECGVISNRAEEKQLADPATQARIVGAIVRALEEFLAPSAASAVR